ncbi:MAG: hypothetical protein AMXMBFR44_6580 [Candidatus Campbellbacteria bacterium]
MKHRTRTHGFTIIELIVTVGIFAMISAVLLVRNSKFDDEALLQSAAYEVALSVRQAQNYGINVQGQEGTFDKAYGVYFETASTSYTLFYDLDENSEFSENEFLEGYVLGRGYTIERICPFSDLETLCQDRSEDAVSVVFRRPDPEAIMTAQGGVVGDITSLGIELASPRGGRRFIIVRQTGQIGVINQETVEGGSGSEEL